MSLHGDIKAALEAATPEPWDYHADQHRDDGRVWRLGGDGDDICRLAYPDREADAHLIANAPTWLAELLAEVESLARWKTEALPVITGLQELGSALGIPLGKRITGPDALAAVKALTARAEAAEQAVQRVRGLAGELRAKRYLTPTATADAILRALDGAS